MWCHDGECKICCKQGSTQYSVLSRDLSELGCLSLVFVSVNQLTFVSMISDLSRRLRGGVDHHDSKADHPENVGEVHDGQVAGGGLGRRLTVYRVVRASSLCYRLLITRDRCYYLNRRERGVFSRSNIASSLATPRQTWRAGQRWAQRWLSIFTEPAQWRLRDRGDNHLWPDNIKRICRILWNLKLVFLLIGTVAGQVSTVSAVTWCWTDVRGKPVKAASCFYERKTRSQMSLF